MKIKVVLALVLALALVAGATVTILAKPEEKGKPPVAQRAPFEIRRGVVVSIDTNKLSFVIQQDGKEFTITTDNNTKYFTAPLPPRAGGLPRNRLGEKAAFADISVGDRVDVRVEPGTNLAKLVLIFEPAEIRRGVVVQTDNATLSFVIKQDDKQFTITTDNATKYFTVPLPPRAGGLPLSRSESKAKPGAGSGLIPGKGKGIGWSVPSLRAPGERATFGDISVGDRVDVWVKKGTNLAEVVLIFKKVYEQVTGTITALDTANKTITITPQTGTAVTVKYDERTVFTLRGSITVAVGQRVHAVYRIKDMWARTVNILPATAPAPLTPGTRSA